MKYTKKEQKTFFFCFDCLLLYLRKYSGAWSVGVVLSFACTSSQVQDILDWIIPAFILLCGLGAFFGHLFL